MGLAHKRPIALLTLCRNAFDPTVANQPSFRSRPVTNHHPTCSGPQAQLQAAPLTAMHD